MQNKKCKNDYRDAFLQVTKTLGLQKTELLFFADMAAKQANAPLLRRKGEMVGGENAPSSMKAIITALGDYTVLRNDTSYASLPYRPVWCNGGNNAALCA